MVAQYTFDTTPQQVSKEQWIEYFCKAPTPSHVDYAVVDDAMKRLNMETKWPEPESRMMNLQADMKAVLDQFNLTDFGFEHEQRRLVKYLAYALAPQHLSM